jgi:hypothetical protein
MMRPKETRFELIGINGQSACIHPHPFKIHDFFLILKTEPARSSDTLVSDHKTIYGVRTGTITILIAVIYGVGSLP